MSFSKKLVVIGNGFDLNIGLHSSYQAFFDWITKINDDGNYKIGNLNLCNRLTWKPWEFYLNINMKSSEINEKSLFQELYAQKGANIDLIWPESLISQNKDNYGKNFWILYFQLISELESSLVSSNWNNIENIIKGVVTDSTYKDLFNRFKRIFIRNNGNYYDNEIININNYLEEQIEASKSHETFKKNIIFFTIISLIMEENKIDEMNFYDFLFDQLFQFESMFGLYLRTAIKNLGKNLYDTRSDELMFNLKTGKKIENKSTEDNFEYSVLNFNYTTANLNTSDTNNQNVHSTIYDHPIFGIDSKVLNENDNDNDNSVFKFTKTFRIMSLAAKNKPKTIFGRDIYQIIFYGHSLSEADNSYFISIFDHFNIYQDKISLIFKYNAPCSKDDGPSKISLLEKESLNKLEKKVFNLINDYGKSKGYGDDLLNKILLENRLSFEKTLIMH